MTATAHPGRLADLTDLACPPYDVISEFQRLELESRDPHNAVRLELADGADPHAAAASTLAAWTADGTLAREPEPRFYYYAHARTDAPDEPLVHGVVGRVLLEPWGAGIRPHEHTMPGPKADRLGAAARHADPALADPRLLLRPQRALSTRHEPRLERRMARARR